MTQMIQIKAGENLFDAAIRLYGCLDGLLELRRKNQMDFTSEVAAGQVLEGEAITFEKKTITLPASTEVNGKKATLKPSQNMFDMAIQEYGTMEGVFILAKDNMQSLTEDLEPGTNLKIRTEPLNQAVVNFYQFRKLKPATGLSAEENEELKPEGIGYWAIEYDFIVS